MEKVHSSVNVVTTDVMKINVEPPVDEKLKSLVYIFWKHELIHVTEEVNVYVIQKFKQDIKCYGSRYTVRLPFKADIYSLPGNNAICKRRLESLLKRLKRNLKLMESYDGVMRQQEKDGFAKPVHDEVSEIGRLH